MAYHLSMDFSRPDNARRINRLKVLSELRKGTCSKAELSRRLDINKVSIGEICDKMIKEGLIEEIGREQTAQGRPGTLLSINSKAGRVFSIEEGRKAFSVAVSDLQGRILRYERLPKGESFQDDIQKLHALLCDPAAIGLQLGNDTLFLSVHAVSSYEMPVT